MLAAGHSVLPLSFISSFFRRLISEVAWPIVTNFATCSMVTQIYKIRSEILVAVRNLATQKHQNFGAISHNFAT